MADEGSGAGHNISNDDGLDGVRFAWDVLSFILPICGFPKEKIKSTGRKENVYNNNDFIFLTGARILNVALYRRDEWKRMFESRHKSSEFDSAVKIVTYLISHLAISPDYRQGNAIVKMHVSLAAYSEMMLFLTYKGIEFDFEHLITLWAFYFLIRIVKQQDAGESLKLLYIFNDLPEFIEWIKAFSEDIATPYGYRDDVSEMFREHSDILQKFDEKKNFLSAELFKEFFSQSTIVAVQPASVLNLGFESSAVLSGEQESPQPLGSSENSVSEGEKESRLSTHSADASKCESKGMQRRNTSSELLIEDRLGQMSLDSEKSPQKNKRKRGKPKNR